jgi:hypothetical protein
MSFGKCQSRVPTIILKSFLVPLCSQFLSQPLLENHHWSAFGYFCFDFSRCSYKWNPTECSLPYLVMSRGFEIHPFGCFHVHEFILCLPQVTDNIQPPGETAFLLAWLVASLLCLLCGLSEEPGGYLPSSSTLDTCEFHSKYRKGKWQNGINHWSSNIFLTDLRTSYQLVVICKLWLPFGSVPAVPSQLIILVPWFHWCPNVLVNPHFSTLTIILRGWTFTVKTMKSIHGPRL